MRTFTLAMAALVLVGGPALAQAPAPSPEIDACKASGLIALKAAHPSTTSLTIDADTATVSKTDLMVDQTKVRTIVMGLASIDTAKSAKPNQFVCLIGDKGKVLLTFFTQK